jgi:hypothetical protein
MPAFEGPAYTQQVNGNLVVNDDGTGNYGKITCQQINGTVPLSVAAATTTAGYTLVNATGTILTWTAPNDGKLHRAKLFYTEHVSSGKTGGGITFGSLSGAGNGTLTPDGAAGWQTVMGGGESAGARGSENVTELIVGAGNTIFLYQNSALSAGAAVAWAEIWAS